MFKTAATAFL